MKQQARRRLQVLERGLAAAKAPRARRRHRQPSHDEHRTVLRGVSWQAFEALRDERDAPRGRLALDAGLLEIMSPGFAHENLKTLIARFLETLTEELDIPIRSVASTTLKRRRQQQAVEADECYYVRHEPLVKGDGEDAIIDLVHGPPPDLAIEVDITRSSLIRMKVLAAIGVREVWRWYGDRLELYRLQRDGTYRPIRKSRVLPMLPIDGLMRLLNRRGDLGETQLVRTFRAWVTNSFAGSPL